jgi:hypothetical protein
MFGTTKWKGRRYLENEKPVEKRAFPDSGSICNSNLTSATSAPTPII